MRIEENDETASFPSFQILVLNTIFESYYILD